VVTVSMGRSLLSEPQAGFVLQVHRQLAVDLAEGAESAGKVRHHVDRPVLVAGRRLHRTFECWLLGALSYLPDFSVS
jgi:hypothetical protein